MISSDLSKRVNFVFLFDTEEILHILSTNLCQSYWRVHADGVQVAEKRVFENVPDRMNSRPVDARGFPIPFGQYVDPKTGVPDFRVMDHDIVLRCLRNRWCALCGNPLGSHIHFIGGPACVKNGYFFDPAMHKECAEFAMQACPHLSRAKGRYNEAASYPEADGLHVVVTEIVSPVVSQFEISV